MIEDMYAVMNRIHDIKKKFGSVRNNQQSRPAANFHNETVNRIQERVNDVKARDVTVAEIKKIVAKYSQMNRIPSSLVNAVINAESSYNPRAVSKKGAMGLMQLMPDTVRELGIGDPFEPEDNIRGGVSVLKRLLDKYNWDYKKALSAYNAGESSVDKNGGNPPYRETADYVKKVINAYMANSE
jgi:soluble lytic murein transglycosylase-like protein